MTDSALTAALSAADYYIASLSRYRHGDDGPANPADIAGTEESARFFASVMNQPRDVRDAGADRLAEGVLTIPDPLAAALAAYQVGSLIEQGADPAVLGDVLRTRLRADFAAARRFAELVESETHTAEPDRVDPATLARLGRREREGASAWAALRYSTCAAMAAWCRHRASRLVAREAAGLRDDARALGDRGGYCFFIAELLEAADGTRLAVISPEQHRGFVVELEAVRNAAHLFALLEDTVVGDASEGWLAGRRVDAKVAAVARGEGFAEAGMTFSVGWHYEYWWGLHPEGAARELNLHPLVAAMIGVEATVHDLPEFRGRPVVLMRPAKIGSRACDINFFAPLHDALRSGVRVLQRLTSEEVDALCEEMRAEAAEI